MKRQKIIQILTYIFLFPFLVFVVFNTINSLLRTTYFDLHQYVEIAKYRWDNVLFNLIIIAVVCAVLCGVVRSEWFVRADILKGACVFAGLFSLGTVLIFRCMAKCDSEALSDIAIEFLQGNYEAFAEGAYLYGYPFQLGMTALIELIYGIFGIENYVAFQLFNVVCIVGITGALNRITGELFEEESVRRLEAVLSFGLLPLFLYATFIYGDIPGWCMGIHAIYFTIRYLKTDRWQEILKASLLFSLGVLIKSNMNILVVAAVIVLVLHAVEKKDYRGILWAGGLFLFSRVGTEAVNLIYTFRAGLEKIPEGIPKIAWIAMSMQEPVEGGSASGWYNGYNWTIYLQSGYNREMAEQICMENLKNSLGRFVHEQRYALRFFYDKFTSQWNTPDFMSLITSEWYSRNGEKQSALAEFFIYGLGRNLLLEIMNVYHSFIFLCTGIFCLSCRKKWRLERAYYILNIFGGLLFHMLWEAKARYVLGYFVLLLPLAAYGCYTVTGRILNIVKERSKVYSIKS